MNNKESGFIKALVIIVVAVILLAASGVSIRKHLQPDQIASTTQQVSERGENFYTEHLEKPLNTFIITPTTIAWQYIEEHGVESVSDWLENILKNSDV